MNQPARLTKTLEAMGWTKEIQQLKQEVAHLKSAAPSDSELGPGRAVDLAKLASQMLKVQHGVSVRKAPIQH